MLQAHGVPEIPAETERIARLAFPKSSLAMKLRDELGMIYSDEQFSDLFPERGQPAESPARLALVTVLQFAEGLTDRQAADAVRGRIDWKYALGLELSDPGFDYSVLSEFRSRLLGGSAEERLLTAQLKLFQARGLVKAGGRQRTDSTHVLAVIRQLNRLELVGESLRYTLNELAQVAPDWLVTVAQPDWYERYGRRFDSFHLPESREKRQTLAQQIGVDGHWLLAAALASTAPEAVRTAPCLQVLRQIWIQQYYINASGDEAVICVREPGNLPPAARCICSPYDLDARYARHNAQVWVGYRTHLTESCDPDAQIHVITQVETVLAPTQDVEVVETIHADLAEQGLKPKQHYVDAAYLSADLLVSTAQQESIELIGPVTKLQNVSWQAKEQTGYDTTQFQIDWDTKQATCPQGQTSVKWYDNVPDRTGNAGIQINFPAAACQACATRSACTRSVKGGRTIRVQPRAQYEALRQARNEQTTAAFAQKYRPRLGIEGTISQAVRAFELRTTRYFGFAKTHLHSVALAAAINLCRFVDYLTGVGLKSTRTSAFAALATR
jgi:transposase